MIYLVSWLPALIRLCAKRRPPPPLPEEEARRRLREREEDEPDLQADAELHVVVRNLAGARLDLTSLTAGTPWRSFRATIEEKWHIPVLCQRFVLGMEVIDACDARPLGAALGMPRGGAVELSCMRVALPPELQQEADSALRTATARGDCAEMAAQIAQGARDVSEDPGAPSSLMIALAAGDAHAAQVLRNAGATEPSMEPGSTHLGQAFADGRFADVVRLLALGASCNHHLVQGQGIRDTNHGSPLHACCAQHRRPGATAVAELLCRLKADPNSKDSEGDSTMAHAHYFGAQEIIKVLESHGAEISGPYYSRHHGLLRRLLRYQ